MIAGLRGTVAGKESDAVLIDVNGVIYRVGTSSTTLSELRGEAETVYFHTRLVVREDQLSLYGFLSPEEVILFDLVTGVTGIGPRIGCAILSRFTPEALHAALMSEDVTLLSSVPGIGKKTAARMIVELRGKLPTLEGGVPGAFSAAPADIDAVEALKALGYTAAEAHAALAGTPREEGATVEERIVAALQVLGGS